MSDTTITITQEERAEIRRSAATAELCCLTSIPSLPPSKVTDLLNALEQAEGENARLRERLESALDKIADIQENGEEEGACHACGICAGCPEDWQPTDDHNCRVMLELWADGEPLPWEAARRAVADSGVNNERD